MDKKQIAIIAVTIALIAVAVSFFIMRSNSGSGSVTLSASDPAIQNINWVKQKSKECGGDINKMSPADKAKTISILGRQYAAQSVKMYSTVP